jgi:pimeloyl-ACP methyl ester carboxylesterase
LIFIHGSGETSKVWKNQLSDLNLRIPIIGIDLPSHGNSDYYPNLSLDLYVNSIKKLQEDLKLNKIILCGHSLGGAVALSFYFNYQRYVSGLILMSTGAKLRVLPVILNNTKNNFETFLKNIPVGAFYKKTDQSIQKWYVNEVSKIKPIVVHNDFKICDNFDVMGKIDQIRVPCLILVGKYDKLTPLKYSEYFHKKIPNSMFEIIPNAGHSVMIENPKETNQIIEDFIKTNF